MATASPMKDMEDKFFRCSVCLETMKDPKMMPCLHRYCNGCLQKMIGNAGVGASLVCPLCRQECKIPEGWAAGFKTDFHLKGMLEYVEMHSSFPPLEVEDSPSPSGEAVTTTERRPQTTAFRGIRYTGARGIKVEGYLVYDMTSCEGNGLVITGRASDVHSFIAVTDAKGKMTRHIRIPREGGSTWQPFRYCEALSQYMIATVCQTNQLGIFNVRDGSLTKRNIRDVVSGWAPDCFISCVTTDPRDRNILVGSMSKNPTGMCKDVLVFDKKFKYRHSLILPDGIRGARDMVVHDHNLIVCDRHSGTAYDIKMKGKGARLVHEFAKPYQGAVAKEWYPVKVCTDDDGFVYMLWGSLIKKTQRRVVTKYGQDEDRQLMETMPLHGGTMCICSPVKNYPVPRYRQTQGNPAPGVAGPGI